VENEVDPVASFNCPNHSTRAREALGSTQSVHGRFLRCGNFLLQNCASQRNVARISLALLSSEKHAAQRREKLRKHRSLNYKSAASEAQFLPQTSNISAAVGVETLLTIKKEKNETYYYWDGLCVCRAAGVCADNYNDRPNDNDTATTTTETTTTYTAGTVTTYEPSKTIVVKSDEGPVSFALGTAARIVNGAGQIVTAPLRAGQKVRVYYTGPTERRTVERVVVED
jgi:hypothetical protein